MNFTIFPNRHGHFQNYAELIAKLSHQSYIPTTKKNYRTLFLSDRTLFIDGDGIDLFYASALAPIRFLLGKKTYVFSVRTEDLMKQRPKSMIKRYLIKYLLTKYKGEFISIHNTNDELKRYTKDKNIPINYINDPQLWDLSILKIHPRPPCELNGVRLNHIKRKPILFIPGKMTSKRNSNHFVLRAEKLIDNFTIIIAGQQTSDFRYKLKSIRNIEKIILIDRYISDEELVFLYMYSDYIYAFYSTDIKRPSGVLGRALQLNKKVIVNKNGFLYESFGHHNNIIGVSDLCDIIFDMESAEWQPSNTKPYDSSNTLKKILLS